MDVFRTPKKVRKFAGPEGADARAAATSALDGGFFSRWYAEAKAKEAKEAAERMSPPELFLSPKKRRKFAHLGSR